MNEGDGQKASSRSGAIDMVRVLAMLSIIKVHSVVNEPLWNIYCGFLGAGAGVVFFFFFAALFLKPDVLSIYRRAGWLFACYVFWGVLAWWLLIPIVQYLLQCIKGGDSLLFLPSLMSIPLSKVIQWDWTQTFPYTGTLWFLRLLLLLTIVSPLLLRFSGRVLIIMGCVFWAIRYTGIVSSPECREWLPFILNAEWPSVSVAAYMFALAINKAGGIRVFLEYGQRLYLVAAMICVLRLAIVFTGFNGCIAADIGILVPFALCILLLWLERLSLMRRLGGFISLLAPGVFSVYILHAFLNPIVYAVGFAWFDGVAYRVYCILIPVLVFVLCWLIYLMLVRIPHCSMLLCFVSRKKV